MSELTHSSRFADLGARRPAFSVVIPAHNEKSVIARGLAALTDGADGREIDIVVVCNGCDDGTADVARKLSQTVRVHEIATASKTAALNAGDRLALHFPRIYVDADVVLPLDAARRIARHLAAPGAMAASPRARMDFGPSSWPVRAYYSTWMELPWVAEGLVGVGVFALSEEGRARFGEFPDVISDDGFVRAHFSRDERPVVDGATVDVRAPSSLGGLIRIKTRSRLGGYELKERYPALHARLASGGKGAFGARALTQPSKWAAMCTYVGVNVAARVRATMQRRRLSSYKWERDESSRATSAGDP